MSDPTSALYRNEILDHARHPRNSGRLARPDLTGTASNPLCGDEAQVTLSLAHGEIGDIRVLVRGCVISQAAGSMISEAVRSKSLEQAAELGRVFEAVLEGSRDELPAELVSLNPLVEVRRNRSRIGCVLLPWQALRAAKP